MNRKSNPVIVLIFVHDQNLEWFEKISLEQCYRILGKHPIRLVCPEGLNLAEYRAIVPEIHVDFIPRHWLQSVRSYNRLKILPWLYRRYSGFDFMLTHELDAFVFRDELLEWCERGWDYIGAPWFEGFQFAEPDAPFRGVGNSGFSLRRIRAMIDVRNTWRTVREPAHIIREILSSDRGSMRKAAAMAKGLLFNNFHPPFTLANCNMDDALKTHDDCFWCLEVPKRFPTFKVASLDDAKRFSFEVNPSRLYAECGERLPFGCHKWMNFEPQFWIEHIRSFGYEIQSQRLNFNALKHSAETPPR
jgi:hypothetical protein